MSQRELFRVEGLPVFQNKVFPDRDAALACPRGDVVLVQDTGSGLIYNRAFNAALLSYDTDYQNEQAVSEAFRRHLTEVKSIIERYFSGRALVEIGCGKGYFLEYLQQEGFTVAGIDPAYEGHNPSVIKALFAPELGIRADAVILRHVLEHMVDPIAFLAAIAEANGGRGRIYIEVPCFDWICRRRAWFDIFYEHVNYFRLADFRRMFTGIEASGHVFGGQYLYVVADLATLHRPAWSGEDGFDFPVDFLAGVKRIAEAAKGKRCAIWGGASKGVTFVHYMQRAGVAIETVIDINPAKQNRFMAGCSVKIVSPAEGMKQLRPGDSIFIMNSNYRREIVAASGNRFNYVEVDRLEH